MTVRACGDCGLEYTPAARNQKRCTPCRVLRDLVYWETRGLRSCARCGAEHQPLNAGDDVCASCAAAGSLDVCVLCSCGGEDACALLDGTPVCVACFKSSDALRRASAMHEAVSSQENRREYAQMGPDPLVPARGSSEYEVIVRKLWALPEDVAASALGRAEGGLRAAVGMPVPRYLVLAAALVLADDTDR